MRHKAGGGNVKAVFVQDLFRSPGMGSGDVLTNVTKLMRILRPVFHQIGVNTALVAPKSQGGAFDEVLAAAQQNLEPGIEGWANLLLNADYRCFEGSLELLTGDIVIGWGMTPSLINFLSGQGKVYVDFELSPIRFGQELFLKLRTNSAPIGALASGLGPEKSKLLSYAQSLSASVQRGPTEFSPASWGYFIGQSHVDASLVEGGSLRKPSEPEILARVSALAKNVDFLGVIPHPYAAARDAHLLPLLREINNAVIVPGTAYDYLMKWNTDFVTSLSSSTLVESEFFGVDGIELITPDIRNPQNYREEVLETECVDSRVLELDFWTRVFEKANGQNEEIVGVNDLVTPSFHQYTGKNYLQALPVQPSKQVSGLRSTVDVSTDDRVNLAYGWHEREETGVWTKGLVSSLFVRLSESGKFRLEISGARFWQNDMISSDAEIEVIGCNSERRTIHPNGSRFSESFEVTPGKDGLVCVQFFIRNPFSPRQAGLSDEDDRLLGVWLKRIFIELLPGKGELEAIPKSDYYAALHSFEFAYQHNNWLLAFASFLGGFGFRKIVECGTGNGAFVAAVSGTGVEAVGLDWVASPVFPHSSQGVSFRFWDAHLDEIPRSELCCSGDFLEHVASDFLDTLLERMLTSAKAQFHLIACNDDGQSHLSVLTPSDWLERFEIARRSAETPISDPLELTEINRGNGKTVAIISNLNLHGAPAFREIFRKALEQLRVRPMERW